MKVLCLNKSCFIGSFDICSRLKINPMFKHFIKHVRQSGPSGLCGHGDHIRVMGSYLLANIKEWDGKNLSHLKSACALM